MAQSHSLALVSVKFLSQCDDLLTALLLDSVIFGQDPIEGRKCAKMNASSRAKRLTPEDLQAAQQVVDGVRQGTMTTQDATDKICDLTTVKRFVKQWDNEMLLFQTHLKRYLLALRPESAIAFHETDRYTKPPKAARLPADSVHRMSPERAAKFIDVAVFATRKLKKGEVIDLRGGFAQLTEEEDDQLRNSGEKMDFSVFWSDRLDCFSLLLGPARFVNHDCRNNVEFQFSGASMKFKVTEDIEADEEIFTNYGAHYFEQDNAACLCSTCELFKRGAFAPASKGPRKVKEPANATRRSGRVMTAPDLGRPTLLAQKGRADSSASMSSNTTTSSILSRRSSSTRMTTPSSTLERRRSDRVTTPADELRSLPRKPHERLPPPPGYATQYRWDSRKKIAKYCGPHVSDYVARKRAEAMVQQLGKRKRGNNDEDSDAASPSRLRRRASSCDSFDDDGRRSGNFFRSRVQKLPKIVSLGTRTSKRGAALGGYSSASAREIAFKRLEQALGVDSDSELSDIASVDDTESVRSVRYASSDLTDIEDLDVSTTSVAITLAARSRSSSLSSAADSTMLSIISELEDDDDDARVTMALDPEPRPPDLDPYVQVLIVGAPSIAPQVQTKTAVWNQDTWSSRSSTPEQQLHQLAPKVSALPPVKRHGRHNRAGKDPSSTNGRRRSMRLSTADQGHDQHFHLPSRREHSVHYERSVSAESRERSRSRTAASWSTRSRSRPASSGPELNADGDSESEWRTDDDDDASGSHDEPVDAQGQQSTSATSSSTGAPTNSNNGSASASTSTSITLPSMASGPPGGLGEGGGDGEHPDQASKTAAQCEANGDATDEALARSASEMVKKESITSDGLSGRDEQDKEAAQLLMTFMLGGGSNTPTPAPSVRDSPAASTTLPATSSSTAASLKNGKNKARATPRPSLASTNPRSTRRNSRLDVNAPLDESVSNAAASKDPAESVVPEEPPKASSSKPAKKTVADKPASRSRSRPAPGPAAPSTSKRIDSPANDDRDQAPVPSTRGTRRSAPISNGLHDVITSDMNAFVNGAYDPESGRYLSAAKIRKLALEREAQGLPPLDFSDRRRAASSPSTMTRSSSGTLSSLSSSVSTSSPKNEAQADQASNVAVATQAQPSSSSSASSDLDEEERVPFELPLDTQRTTRRSAPLPVDVRRLLDSPTVAAAVGGYDRTLGRYVSPRKRRNSSHQQTPAPAPSAVPTQPERDDDDDNEKRKRTTPRRSVSTKAQ